MIKPRKLKLHELNCKNLQAVFLLLDCLQYSRQHCRCIATDYVTCSPVLSLATKINVSKYTHTHWQRDSSVRVQWLYYGLDNLYLIPGWCQRFFSSQKCPDRFWGQQPHIQQGAGATSLEMKQPGCEAHHTPPVMPRLRIWSCNSYPYTPSWHEQG
jgi:hypothetical protein